MSVKHQMQVNNGVFFITLTCWQWINLFEIANAYTSVYNWFDYLKSKGHHIIGYVIMPNHLHSLIGFKSSKELSINKIIGNGKRFMAYDMVDRLKVLDQPGILEVLSSNVNTSDHRKGKIHQVFEPSFDWKECWTEKFMVQKLDYMHANPCRGNWSLADEYWEYPHSSGHFYATGNQGVYPVTHVGELRNIDLTLE